MSIEVSDHTDFLSYSNVKNLESKISISNTDDDLYDNGLNFFGLFEGTEGDTFSANKTHVLFTSMNGTIVHEPLTLIGNNFSQITFINSTTILGNFNGKPMFWNIITNQTEIFNFSLTNQHHDLKYNPSTETFILLEKYLDFAINQNNQTEQMIFDRLSEYDKNGNVIWRWRTGDYAFPPINLINISGYYETLKNNHLEIEIGEFNGQSYPYLTGANSIDIVNDYIYLNLGNLNQFVKIQRGLNIPEYVAGANTELILKDKQGNTTTGLWYRSHDLNYLGDNQFLMFDNNYRNYTDIALFNDLESLGENEILTNPVYNYTQSSAVQIFFNETDNSIKEVFRWKGPSNWWSTEWGSARKLTNGNFLITFGAPFKGLLNNPLNSTTGGSSVEITPSGQKVWQMTLPSNWGSYRVYRIKPTTTVSPIAPKTVNVGDKVEFNYEDAFSNFPSSYRIEISGVEVKTETWHGEPIHYTVDTTGFSQGEFIFALYLIDQSGGEKGTAVEVVVLFQRQSTKDRGSFELEFWMICLFIPLFIKKNKIKNSIHR